MQPTKFWHELTDQQRHFLTLLASGEEANIELAKQLLLGLLRGQNGEDYLAGLEKINEKIGFYAMLYAEELAEFRRHQREFFEKSGCIELPDFFLNHSKAYNENCFSSISRALVDFRCSRCTRWAGSNKYNKYVHLRLDVENYALTGDFAAKFITHVLGEFERFISYPFGYKGSIIYSFVLIKSNDEIIQNLASFCNSLLSIDPDIIFRFAKKSNEEPTKINLAPHDSAIEILKHISQPKKWAMNAEDVAPMLLHGREPIPNPLYLSLENTCFYVRKHQNGATNPEQGWLDILAASPEWKERNLTYKFID